MARIGDLVLVSPGTDGRDIDIDQRANRIASVAECDRLLDMGELLDPVLQHLRCECRAVVESTHVVEAIDHPQMPVVALVPDVTGAEPSLVVSGSRGSHRLAGG